MKKLITAAMTLALAAGMASAQVESANIVGYTTQALPTQQQIQLTNPMPVESTDLQSITMDGVTPTGGTVLWWWNKDTRLYTRASWVALYDGETPLGVNGWGDAGTWEAIDKTFAAGEGFWIKARAGATVRFENPFYVAP